MNCAAEQSYSMFMTVVVVVVLFSALRVLFFFKSTASGTRLVNVQPSACLVK